MIDIIINNVINNFDFSYILIVNVLTYSIIKTIYHINNKTFNTFQKRIILLIVMIVISIIYKLLDYNNIIVLVNSSILSPIAWSWLAKPIANKLGIDYKQ